MNISEEIENLISERSEILWFLKNYLKSSATPYEIEHDLKKLLPNTNMIEFLEAYQGNITFENLPFIKKMHICKIIGSNLISKIHVNPYDHCQIEYILGRFSEIHSRFCKILKENNPQLKSVELVCYKSIRNFFNVLSFDSKHFSLLILLSYKHKIFCYKYLSLICDTDLFSVFVNLYKLVQSDEEKMEMGLSFVSTLVKFERYHLAEKVTQTLFAGGDRALCEAFCHLMLKRWKKSLDGPWRHFSESRHHCFELEIRFCDSVYRSSYTAENNIDVYGILAELQTVRNPSSLLSVLKLTCKPWLLLPCRQKSHLNRIYSLRLPKLMCHLAVKHFRLHSLEFCMALKAVTKSLMLENRVLSRRLAEYLLGICEMVFFTPCKTLACANLLLARHTVLANEQSRTKDDAYAKEAYKMASILPYADTLCIRILLWRLQLVAKFDGHGLLTRDWRKLMNEAAYRITCLEIEEPMKHRRYTSQLELIDSLASAIHSRNAICLLESTQQLLTSCWMIELGDSISVAKMKLFCRSSILVAQWNLQGGQDRCRTDPINYERLELSYNKLARPHPRTDFLVSDGVWQQELQLVEAKRRGQLDTEDCDSGTDDSDSDSASDECDIVLYS